MIHRVVLVVRGVVRNIKKNMSRFVFSLRLVDAVTMMDCIHVILVCGKVIATSIICCIALTCVNKCEMERRNASFF